MATEQLVWKGNFKGHKGQITALATHPAVPDYVISASRDKSVIVWKVDIQQAEGNYGVAQKRLVGHNHFVSDLALTTDTAKNLFILSGSWDKSLRLWDFNKGKTTLRFVNHSKDVLSVAFSADNRQIVSGSRDRTIKVWNTLGQCKYTFGARENGHKDWVSCVRFSPSQDKPLLVSASWDKEVKVWDMKTLTLKQTLSAHKDYINTVTVSPDSTLVASGGRDGSAKLFDLADGKELYSLDTNNDTINCLAFSPLRYWLAAATQSGLLIWDLETKQQIQTIAYNGVDVEVEAEEAVEPVTTKKQAKAKPNVAATSLAWSHDGSTLYVGYANNVVRAYTLEKVGQ